MTEEKVPRKVEAIECPGWVSSDGKRTHRCGPERSAYGGGRPNIIRADQDMCDRCARQRAKYEAEFVLRNKAIEEQRERRAGRGQVWLTDLSENVRDWAREYQTTLQSLVADLEQLPARDQFGHGDEPYRKTTSTWGAAPSPADRWDVLRLLAGLDVTADR